MQKENGQEASHVPWSGSPGKYACLIWVIVNGEGHLEQHASVRPPSIPKA